jgi:hypothetical protein
MKARAVRHGVVFANGSAIGVPPVGIGMRHVFRSKGVRHRVLACALVRKNHTAPHRPLALGQRDGVEWEAVVRGTAWSLAAEGVADGVRV